MDEKEMNELRDLLSHLNGDRWVKIKNFKHLKSGERVRYVHKNGDKVGFDMGNGCYLLNSKWFGKIIASFEYASPLIHCISEQFESEIKTLEVLRK